MKKTTLLSTAVALLFGSSSANAQNTVKGQNATFKVGSDLMTPEALWAMGRIGSATALPSGKQVVYQVGCYSARQNKSQQMLFVMDANGKNKHQLTTGQQSEIDDAWIEQGRCIAFITGGQPWSMNADGGDRKQLTNNSMDTEGFKFSPDERKVILVKSLLYHGTIQANPTDLPLATGRLATDVSCRHWNHHVEIVVYPFVADYDGSSIDEGVSVLQGESLECPTAPSGGTEQLVWGPDPKSVAHIYHKKEGVQYAISTDTDIYLYDVATCKTKNPCKPSGYEEPTIDTTRLMKNQAVNH